MTLGRMRKFPAMIKKVSKAGLTKTLLVKIYNATIQIILSKPAL